ncbi:hypothetical protein LWI29_006524 [Acer saccharum]|uniref:Uncharacterized protein n=1 Tax=Acer saccharum TaxID=4024 RepID=A0AA39SMM9_ACESA|nr:hypothetical protein LWI29_006524 [Acer saccharum]
MTGRRDEVAGEVGGDNRRPLEEVNCRQLDEKKSPAVARREIDGRWRRWIAGRRRCACNVVVSVWVFNSNWQSSYDLLDSVGGWVDVQGGGWQRTI